MFELTLNCNLNCKMCFQKERRRGGGRKDLTTEQVFSVIDNILDFGLRKRDFRLWGGECFMRDDLFEIIEYLGDNDCSLHLITNGTLMTQDIVERLDAAGNVRSIMVSLDSCGDKHDVIRGSKDAWNKTVEGIRLLSGKSFSLSVLSVIQEDNAGDLPGIIGLCSNLGVDHEFFVFESYSTREELEETKNMLGLGDDVWNSIHEDEEMFLNFREMQDALAVIRRGGRRNRISTYYNPRVLQDFPIEFHEGRLRSIPLRLTCSVLQHLMVDSMGNVVVCPFMDKTFGNLLTSSLKGLWNSDGIRDFRKTLVENNMTPLCKRCIILDYVRGD
jgi:radical SAM protein with 4Fe4S-binding SPASM domain